MYLLEEADANLTVQQHRRDVKFKTARKLLSPTVYVGGTLRPALRKLLHLSKSESQLFTIHHSLLLLVKNMSPIIQLDTRGMTQL